MVTHRLSRFSCVYIYFFTGQLNVLAYLFSFFTVQLNVLASNSFFLFFLLVNSTCWPFTVQPDGPHRLCHSPSHMLGKYFLRCWPLTATGNLTPSNSSSMYAFPGRT